MSQTAKNIIVITSITIIAGFLLGYVYDVTKVPIAEQEIATKQTAYQAVFQTGESFEDIGEDTVTMLNDYLPGGGFENESVTEALIARDASGNQLGYVFGITSHQGYGGDINLSMGIAQDGTFLGYEVLSISETAGLGMNATTDEFKSQFSGKNVSRFSYTKTGKVADYEIDAISGATITTRAVVDAVNAGIACFEKIGGGM